MVIHKKKVFCDVNFNIIPKDNFLTLPEKYYVVILVSLLLSYMYKGKGKGLPGTGHEGPEG